MRRDELETRIAAAVHLTCARRGIACASAQDELGRLLRLRAVMDKHKTPTTPAKRDTPALAA